MSKQPTFVPTVDVNKAKWRSGNMKKISMKLIPALVATAFAGTANAAAFGLLEQSGSGLGNAYAGSAAVAEDASTIYYNPAGMTQLKGKNFSGGFNYIALEAKFKNQGSTVLTAGAQPVDGGDYGIVPNGYFSYQLDEKWFAGIGVNVPFGQRTKYDRTWNGSYTAMDTDIQSINVNPSIAFKMNEAVSLGFGLDYQFFKATYTQRIPVAFGAHSVLKVQGSNKAWGWNAGALFNLSDATRVGISYRSTIKHDIAGHWSSALGGNNASLSIELPDTWILSAFHKLNDKWELLADISQQGWSSIPQLKITTPGFLTGTVVKDYKWKDTTRIALGANYLYNDKVKFRVGIASDEGVVDDAHRTARLPDADRIWYSFGVQYKPNKETALDVGYTYVKANKATVSDLVSSAAPGLGRLNGEFDSNVQILGVQFSQNF